MLRNLIVALALVALAVCLVAAAFEPVFWPTTLMLGGLVALLLFERNRYQERIAVPPADKLRPTDERFIDPESGRRVRVWLDPTGRRLYLDDAQSGG